MYAAAVGRAIEKIGFANGILYGTLPQIAQCLFLGVDKTSFKPYRVHLRKNNLTFDTAYEEKKWGCNCLQISVLIAQQLGLGRHYHDPVILGVGSPSLEQVSDQEKLYGARLLQVWIDALQTTSEAPEMMHRGDFYPFASEMSRLTQFALDRAEHTDERCLFDLGPEDISPEHAPELHVSQEEDSEEIETDIVSLDESEIPEELLQEITDSVDI